MSATVSPTKTSAGLSQASTTAPISGPDAQRLNVDIDLIIISLFILVVLVRLPRCLARLWVSSDRTSGHLLRSTKSGIGPEYQSYYGYSQKGYPPHIASCPQSFRPILYYLKIRVSPGFSVGQMTALITYFAILCFPGFFRTTGPFSDSRRPGWIAVAQLPFLFAFSMKNNALGAMLGMGYEKLNYLHRFLGKFIVLAVNLHAIGYIYRWCFESEFKEKIAIPAYSWGLVGLICMDGLYILSVPWLRKNAYRVFMTTHVLCVVVLLLAMLFHKPALMPWMVICTSIYGVDRLLRLVKTRYTIATITPIPSLGVTRLECPVLTSGWRAGQHVRLQVLSSGMGVFGWSEVHPFTIASAPGGQGLVLLCKKTGHWTNKLYDIASSQRQVELGLDANVKVLVEGPYGGPGHTMIASFSSAVFICAGSGLSLGLSSVEDLVFKDARSVSRVKTIELVWLIQDPSCLYPFLPQFVSLLERTTVPLRISVHYTRPCAEKSLSARFFPSGLCMNAGRPRIEHILETAISKTLRPSLRGKIQEKAGGMLVGICGPTSLADDVSKAVGMIDSELKNQVGGVEIYEEVFGW